MSEQQALKEFVENYKDANGDNPVAAAFSLWTIAKSIPFQLIKAGFIALIMFLGTIILGWYMGLSWMYYIILFIFSFIGFILLVFFGGVKFLSGIAINSVAEIIMGLIAPIDDMYDVYQEYGEENLSRTQFTKRAISEVVLPRVSGVLEFLPMKKSMSKSLGLFTDTLAQEEDNLTYEEVSGSSIKSTIAQINRTAKNTIGIVGRPFYFFIGIFLIAWAFIVLGSIFGYV